MLNRLKPYAYLTYVLAQLHQMGDFTKVEELDKVLPWSDDLPEDVRIKIEQ